MSPKKFNSNLIFLNLLLYLNFLFLIISAKQEIRKDLFDETKLNHLKIKNRFFRGALGDNTFINGKLTEEAFQLYDQLSKNEVVNIFTGLTIVSDYYQLDGFYPFRLDKDEYIPEFKKLVDLVHKNSANFFMQLAHVVMNVMIKPETVYAPSSLQIPNQNRNKRRYS